MIMKCIWPCQALSPDDHVMAAIHPVMEFMVGHGRCQYTLVFMGW